MSPVILDPAAVAFKSPDPSLASASFLRRIQKTLTREPINQRDFFMQAWNIIEPNKTLVPSWHIDLILEYLAAVDMGQIKRLVINIPPRHLKSDIVTVVWPAWSWTESPWLRWIFASYAASLSVALSVKRRRIIDSPWYQKNWGDMVCLEDDQNQKAEYQNVQQGLMASTSVGGSITGKGGDRIVIDDLMNPDLAESKAHRETSIEFYTSTLSTRLDNKKTGAIVAIEQRLHKLDLTSTLLKEGSWTHLSIPAEAPAQTVVKFPLSGRTFLRQEGSVICDEREDKAILAQQKTAMGSRRYLAQYQQDPVSAEGGYFQVAWWKFYRELPVSISKTRGWDTAVKTGQENDYSAGCLVHKCENGYYLDRTFFKARVQYPELKRRIKMEADARPADVEVIEDASAGASVIQDLQRETSLPIIPFISSKDKVTRASVVSPLVEAGKVFLPEGEPWVADFINTMAAFPDVEHDDDADAFVIALMHASGKTLKGSVNLTIHTPEQDDQEED